MSDGPVLVTGTAGFIGYHVAERLLAAGRSVVGLDNVNDYYDVSLKRARLARLASRGGQWSFREVDLSDRAAMEAMFADARPAEVVHLAAQAGVRYSLTNPHVYVASNVTGFLHILEGCRHGAVKHLVYASSSSVYGSNELMPFSERHAVDHPLSLYAATKKANEGMAHSYSHLYGLPTTGLRFFTVYGPWGRPDMALFLFTKAILEGRPIDVFNHGEMSRDFTYIDDIIDGILGVLPRPPAPDPTWSAAGEPYPDPGTSRGPFRVANLGNHDPVPLLDMIAAIEDALGKKAEIHYLPMQPGDVPATYADVDRLTAITGKRPGTPVREGIRRFVSWYREYYRA
ncbi:MAG: NAD-dependent epimerase [Deltaproteobacteria bacterium]|nr:NAD-dependent epimerase [Deltaproteobacteria bacterium]